ncbi:MAG: radical SAM protein [Myxococcota bacterium]
MRLRVLLLFFTDPRRAFSSSVAALSAVVREAGHEPLALEVFRKYRIDRVAEHIDKLAPDVVGASCMTRDWPGAAALLARLQGRAYVVVGGYHASLAPHDVAACEAVDAIAIGEGERPLTWLLAALADTTTTAPRPTTPQPTAPHPLLPTRPGLWVKQSDGWSDPIPQADPVPDIATVPWWDYEVFGSVEQIIEDGINTFGPVVDGYLPTRAGRGCPFSCAYCSAPRWGSLHELSDRQKRNHRPVDHLCDELAALRDRYRPEGFEFWDEHFPVDLDWLERFAHEYPRRVGLPFKVEMHPSAASRKRLTLLRQAGCVLFHCGIEAGDEIFRREVLNRRTSQARLQQVFDDCRALGLQTSASLMTMLPGETREQMRATTQMLHQLRPGSFMWSTYHPLPGTVLGDAAVERWPGPARRTFEDYDDVQTRTPARVDRLERAETFAELGQLQGELVQIALDRRGDNSARSRARPVEIPPVRRPASEALARRHGLAPPGAPPQRARAMVAAVDDRGLVLEVEHPAFARHEIRLAPLDGARHFVQTNKLGLSYRGRQAPPALQQLLRDMAARLNDVDLEALRVAYDK